MPESQRIVLDFNAVSLDLYLINILGLCNNGTLCNVSDSVWNVNRMTSYTELAASYNYTG